MSQAEKLKVRKWELMGGCCTGFGFYVELMCKEMILREIWEN